MSGGAVSDGTNYLVGYIGGTNIYCQIVSPTGQLLGAPLLVASANVGWPPAVAFAGARTNCLIAWSDYSRTNGVTMFGRLIHYGSGTMSTVFPLLSAVGMHGFQKIREVASDGTNFLVLWVDAKHQVGGGHYTNVFAQFVNGTGGLIGSEFVAVSGGTIADDMAASFGKTNFLIAWQHEVLDKYETYCRVVTPAGAIGPVQKINSTTSQDRNPLAMAFDGTNFLVLWNCTTNYGGQGELMLYGRLVSQSGTPVGGELVISTDRSGFPGVAFDGANYLVLWAKDAVATNHTVRARFVDRNGNPIGPVFTPFGNQGTNPPLLPIRGALFAGGKFLLTATFGSFVADPNGDIVGVSGGDVHGRFFPASTTAPYFTNAAIVNGRFQARFHLVPGVTYTLQISTNLTNWEDADVLGSDWTNVLYLADDQPPQGNLFVRARMGWTPAFGLSFFEFANAGGFGSGTTPAVSYPVRLTNYSAAFSVERDLEFPSATNVRFTGPPGSGLTNTPAWQVYGGDEWRMYQAPPVYNPAAAPGGTWTITYKGSNVTFNVPDPQAALRLVVPLPTVNVSGGIIQSVSWVYKNATNGATLGGPPPYMTSIQVQIEDTTGARVYNSPELPPNTTSHTLTRTVNWSNVGRVYMAYDDTLDNHYVVTFTKP
ncbi:MAG: hypothetical protein NZ739_02445 [Verrucomicrobiae bacterium]|nr:hypothetical protein [Verrucomicrobiae bacterium]